MWISIFFQNEHKKNLYARNLGKSRSPGARAPPRDPIIISIFSINKI